MSDESHPHTSGHDLKKRPPRSLVLLGVLSLGLNYQPVELFYNLWLSRQHSETLYWKLSFLFNTGMLIGSSVGSILILRGIVGYIAWPDRPDGKIFDFLIPPEDAEYRALALEIAFEDWRKRYSLRKTWLLYGIHVISTVTLYYVDRIKRGK